MAEMILNSTQSKTVPHIGYNEKINVMYARFFSGKTYAYKNVSQDEYKSILIAPSIGTKLKEVVRGKHYSEI